MPTIKIHLDNEELAAVRKRASALGVKVPDLAYGAVNCMMTHGAEPYCRGRTVQAISEAGEDLAIWDDGAPPVGIYESRKTS